MRARRPKDPPLAPETPGATFGGGGLSATGFLDAVNARRKTSGKLPELEVAIRRARERSASGEWGDANGEILVGLYALLHEIVHGVRPLELEQRGEMAAARAAATKMFRDMFKSDGSRAVEFMKWAWQREKERAKYAKTNGRDFRRLGWRAQFSRSLATDHAVFLRDGRRSR